MERRTAIAEKLLTGQGSYEDYLKGCGHLRGLDEALSLFGEVYRSAIEDGHSDPDDSAD